MSDFRTYQPPGRTIRDFLTSTALVRGIMGPVGSGKTGGCLIDNVYNCMGQAPHPRDYELDRGVRLFLRRTKHAVIRSTTRDLEKTTIPSWLHWVPKGMGHWTGGSGGVPATHTLLWNMGDGTAAHMVVEFVGLGEKKPEEALPGWEGTTGYMNEANLQQRMVMTYLRSRVGRYPAVDASIGFRGATRRAITADFNGVDSEHWLYDVFVQNLQPGYEFFRQPGGMIRQGAGYVTNPLAENIENLPPDYYPGQIAGQPEWFIKAKILNEWAGARDGDPVYTEYDDDRHATRDELQPIPGLPLKVGGDAGLHAAVVIAQQDLFGQLRVLDEVIAPESGMGAEAFGKFVLGVLNSRYGGYRVEDGWYDPAGNQRSASDERSWAMVMQAITGFPWRPTDSNKPGIRQQAVRHALLTNLVINGKPAPGILVSSRCKILLKGFRGSYRLKRSQDAAGNIIAEAEKNHPFSDVHDALQYLCMGLRLHLAAIAAAREDFRPRQTRAEDDYHQAEYGRDLPPPDWAQPGHNSQRQEFADD